MNFGDGSIKTNIQAVEIVQSSTSTTTYATRTSSQVQAPIPVNIDEILRVLIISFEEYQAMSPEAKAQKLQTYKQLISNQDELPDGYRLERTIADEGTAPTQEIAEETPAIVEEDVAVAEDGISSEAKEESSDIN